MHVKDVKIYFFWVLNLLTENQGARFGRPVFICNFNSNDDYDWLTVRSLCDFASRSRCVQWNDSMNYVQFNSQHEHLVLLNMRFVSLFHCYLEMPFHMAHPLNSLLNA